MEKSALEKRIEFIAYCLEDANEKKAAALLEVSERIAKNANDPAYVATWIASWMSNVSFQEGKITEYRNELNVLTWAKENK